MFGAALLPFAALGAWSWVAYQDPITDEHLVGAHIESDDAMLGINCIAGRLQVAVQTEKFLGSYPERRPVIFRFDDGPPVEFTWSYQRSRVAVLTNVFVARQFVRGVRSAKLTYVRMFDSEGEATTAAFILPADTTAVDRVLRTCGEKLD